MDFNAKQALKIPESFLDENRGHSLARGVANAGIVLEKLLIVLEQSLSIPSLRAERRLTISGVWYQNTNSFAHKNFSLSQIS